METHMIVGGSFIESIMYMTECNYNRFFSQTWVHNVISVLYLVLNLYPAGLLPFRHYFTGQRSYYYIVSQFPQDKTNRDMSLLKPFDLWSWLTFTLALFVFSLFIPLSFSCYKNFKTLNTVPGIDKTQLFLRVAFGFTEPDDISGFSTTNISAGRKTISLWE